MRSLFLLAVTPRLAQNAFWLDISGEWRYELLDQPEYASPTYDDAGWRPVKLPRGDAAPLAAVGKTYWIRGRVNLPEALRGQPLALTLGIPAGVYELYVNGQRIPTPTTLDRLSEATVPQPRTYQLRPGSTAHSPLVVALRARTLAMPPSWVLPDVGPYVLSSPTVAPGHEGRFQLLDNYVKWSPRLVTSSVLGALGFVCLMFWVSFREPKHSWFAVSMLGFAFYQVCSSIAPVAGYPLFDSLGSTWILTLTYGLVQALQAKFLLVALGTRSWWLRSLPWLAFALLGAKVMAQWSWLTWRPNEVGVVVAVCMYGALGSRVAQAWREGWPPAQEKLLWAALAFLPLLSLPTFSGLVDAGPFVISTSQVGALSVPVVLLFLLVRRALVDRREQTRLADEIESARKIQNLLLPEPAQASAEWTIETSYQPAREVGGDFYQYARRPDGSQLVLVGDVSGKGLEAAMVASVAVGAFRSADSSSPAEILRIMNRALTGHGRKGFVTCLCARFELDGVTVASAGHPAPYADGREVDVATGLPLGVAAGVTYDESTATGERFTFLSDGVVEAENASRELFGFERTRAISTKSAREIAEAAKAWGQNDDITVVTMRRLG